VKEVTGFAKVWVVVTDFVSVLSTSMELATPLNVPVVVVMTVVVDLTPDLTVV